MSDKLIWVEDYRPKNIEDCILPDRIKNVFRNMVKEKNIQNYAAVGLPGSGKTSSARALCEQLGIDYLIINMSKESGIDTVRNKIVSYASSLSFTSDYKVIILDEFDYANKNSAQPALRGIIEEFAENCRFIITANYENKIMDALFSRCPPIHFEFNNEERNSCLLQYVKRVESILNENNITFDRLEVAKYCKNQYPDFRKTLKTLQISSNNGELQLTSLGSNSTQKINELIGYLKTQDFSKCREWIVHNIQGNDGHLVRRALYDNMKNYLKDESIPEAILLINKYDYQEANVVDKEINMAAFVIELMVNLEFK